MTAARSRLRASDLVGEAVTGVLQRPGRSGLTMLGTVLGIGSFVAILGLTQTASAQISKRFDLLEATTVVVEDLTPERTGEPGLGFPEDASARVEKLNGVVAAGVTWTVPLGDDDVRRRPDDQAPPVPVDVVAAAPGLLRAVGPTMAAGRPIDEFHARSRQKVAVLGVGAARQLGISRLDDRPAVFIGADAYTVIGIIDDTERRPDLLVAVIVPDTVALDRYGPPEPADPASMVVETDVGAGTLVAGQATRALRPDDPATLVAVPPPDPRSLRESVTTDVGSLFLGLAAVAVVVGALGIANTTLVAVLERTAEIGLRRSLGARRRHITLQFLGESVLLGSIGGLVGSAIGVLAVVLVSLAQDWTAVMNPLNVLPGPLVGAVIGLLAGAYPASRAARIEPAQAMRQ